MSIKLAMDKSDGRGGLKLNNIDSAQTHSHSHISASTALQTKFSHRIDPTNWCRLFRGYIRQDWDTVAIDFGIDELRASWIELFFDLVFVACIVHLSSEAAYSLETTSSHRRLAGSTTLYNENCAHDGKYDFIFCIFAQFGLFTVFWLEQVMYTTHFVFNQWIDEILRVIYMTFVLAMGCFVANDPIYHQCFFISYALLRFFSLFMYLKCLLIPRAQWHAIWHIFLYSFIIFILFGLIIFQFEGCAAQYCAIYTVLFLIEYVGGLLHLVLSSHCKPSIALPLNIPHVAERYGLFVMIILGETLIAVMNTDIGELDLALDLFNFDWNSGVLPDVMQIVFFLLTFIMSYCIGRLYYNCQPSEESIIENKNNHALGISGQHNRLYVYSHQWLFFGLLGYGLGVKIAAKHLLYPETLWIDVLLPGYSLVVIIICLNMIRIAHPYNTQINIWLYRIAIIIFMAIIPAFAMKINQGIIFIVSFICVLLLVMVDVEGRAKINYEKIEAKNKREIARKEQHHDDDDNHSV